AFSALRPDVIVSAAAYPAVAKAESDPELAFSVNAAGAWAVAEAAARIGAPVIHISTDYAHRRRPAPSHPLRSRRRP
ncbi:sugar nucleotide-binding protein, partial [Rhizobium ruizarguesonis]